MTITTHRNCSRWVDERFRICTNISDTEIAEAGGRYNVMLRGGVWRAQKYDNLQPNGALEGAFIHLQRWKGKSLPHPSPHTRHRRPHTPLAPRPAAYHPFSHPARPPPSWVPIS